MAELLLRAGSCPITPSGTGELAGYIARDGALSAGTHDDLEAALVVLDDGTRSVAWLTLDAIGVTAALTARLRDAVLAGLGSAAEGLTADDVMVCASHSHSAPLGWSGSIHPGNPGAVSPTMVDELCARIRALATTLRVRRAEPVTAHWHLVRVAGLGSNRLSPGGPHDDRAGVLALRGAEGDPAALVVDFATHPTVLGPDNLHWSADWPGAAREQLRSALAGSGAPVVAFLQGAAGDVSSRFTRRAGDFAEATRLGGLLAAAVLDDLPGGGRRLDPALSVAAEAVDIRRRDLPAPADADAAVGAATAALDALDGPALDPSVRLARTRLDGALVQRDLARATLPAAIELQLAVVALGDVAWAHVPLELFASIGEQIRSRSPFADTRVVGYANGYAGYLADAPAHAAGTYEALSTFFPPDAATAVTDAVAALVDRTAASRIPTSETSR